MSATPELPVITCPSGLVASCAPLLGYQPRRCVVGFIAGVPGRSGAVLVRVDLPEAADVADVADAAERLADSVAGTQGTGVDLVAWVDDPPLMPRSRLSSAPMLEHLARVLPDRGVRVRSMLSTDGHVWWTHDCPYPGCCEDPIALDESVLAQVRAEFAYAGYAPMASREALAERLATDLLRARQVGRSLDGARPPANLERWRDGQVTFLTALLVPGGERRAGKRSMGVVARHEPAPLAASVAARVIRGLQDVAVRDSVLLRLIGCAQSDREPWHRTMDLLCEVVRCAPDGRAAPPATLLGIVAWMTGEGALATVALDRAEADNPWYRLAALTRQVIGRGIDPAVWRHSMSGLTEQECRGGGSRG